MPHLTVRRQEYPDRGRPVQHAFPGAVEKSADSTFRVNCSNHVNRTHVIFPILPTRALLLDQAGHDDIRRGADERADPTAKRPEHSLADERIAVDDRVALAGERHLQRFKQRDLHRSERNVSNHRDGPRANLLTTNKTRRQSNCPYKKIDARCKMREQI